MSDNLFPVIGISRHRLLTDGKGITTLVALNGCHLRCKYCINHEVLNSTKPPLTISPEQLLKKVYIDDIYFRSTGGGITFGGGEPLLHHKYISEFRNLCSDEWKINIETSLNIDSETFIGSLGYVDTYIVDIKDINNAIYEDYTGADNQNVLENLKIASTYHSQNKFKLKIPLIPGYNNKEDLIKSTKYLKTLGFGNIEYLKYKTKWDTQYKSEGTIYGKRVCNLLKHLRTKIAEANNIEWFEEGCQQKLCKGSCPKCEYDLAILSKEIHKIKEPII